MRDLEAVARGGFGLTEAPRIAPDGTIWFADVTGGGVFRIPAGGDAVEEVVPARRGVGGLVLHEQGVVVSGRDLVLVRPDGSQQVLFAPGDEGEAITGFNDLHADANGWLLAGALRFRPARGETPVPGRILVVGPTFIAVVIDEGVDWPNGMGLSPDGATFYVADFAHGTVLAADVDRTGAIAERLRPFARAPEGGSCDGLAVDAEGGVWVATGPGAELVRFAPGTGAVDARVPVAGASFVSSLALVGDEVVVTAVGADGGEVLRGRADVPGVPVATVHV